MSIQKRLIILIFFAGTTACTFPSNGSGGQDIVQDNFQALPLASALAAPENSIRFVYDNVMLVTPPWYSNKITAEYRDLREQEGPSDAVPPFLQIDLREPSDYPYEDSISSQVLVYPLADLKATYPHAADAVTQLDSLLDVAEEPLPDQLPFWPQYEFGIPALTAQAELLDFGSGRGIRYITYLSRQVPWSATSLGLIYTYQGITSDGQYYVSIILPVHITDESGMQNNLIAFLQQSPPNYQGASEILNGLTTEQFSILSLDECDDLVRSLVIFP